jgi:hypothetical protein
MKNGIELFDNKSLFEKSLYVGFTGSGYAVYPFILEVFPEVNVTRYGINCISPDGQTTITIQEKDSDGGWRNAFYPSQLSCMLAMIRLCLISGGTISDNVLYGLENYGRLDIGSIGHGKIGEYAFISIVKDKDNQWNILHNGGGFKQLEYANKFGIVGKYINILEAIQNTIQYINEKGGHFLIDIPDELY